MASSTFKSTSEKRNLNSSYRYSKSISKSPSPVGKRSLSISAISRAKQFRDISTDFSNKRENPLFWTSVSSPTDKENHETSTTIRKTEKEKQREKFDDESIPKKGSGKIAATDQRGRSVTRNSGVKSGIGRSISRVRFVSRGYCGDYQSEKEQEVATLTKSVKSDLKQVICNVKNGNTVRKGAADIQQRMRCSETVNSQHQATEYSEDDSACSFQISNWEDGISTCSLSEAEEKNINPLRKQTKSSRVDEWDVNTSASGIYETVRSEVRLAISDIQNDIESVIQRNNVNAIANSTVAKVSSDLVNHGPIEFLMDIRREYTRKLEESEERARKLRADLAAEEHKGQELSRILQEILPDPKISNSQKPRMGRKSSERKKISKRLTEEAMAYFDECVSISTFDSSDFSAPEDRPRCLAGLPNVVVGTVATPVGKSSVNLPPGALEPPDAFDSYSTCKKAVLAVHDQWMSRCEDSNLVANGSRYEPAVDQVDRMGNGRAKSESHQFSFAQKLENFKSHSINSYIMQFERDCTNRNIIVGDGKSSDYDTAEHDLNRHLERLFGRVFFRNRIDSGGLHLCAGIFPLDSVV